MAASLILCTSTRNTVVWLFSIDFIILWMDMELDLKKKVKKLSIQQWVWSVGNYLTNTNTQMFRLNHLNGRTKPPPSIEGTPFTREPDFHCHPG